MGAGRRQGCTAASSQGCTAAGLQDMSGTHLPAPPAFHTCAGPAADLYYSRIIGGTIFLACTYYRNTSTKWKDAISLLLLQQQGTTAKKNIEVGKRETVNDQSEV